MIDPQAIIAFVNAQKALLVEMYDKAWEAGQLAYQAEQGASGGQLAGGTVKGALEGRALQLLTSGPGAIQRAVALSPAFQSLNRMTAELATMSPPDVAAAAGGTVADASDAFARALEQWVASNAFRLDAGQSVAWAGEQAGYGEAADVDNALLIWQTEDDDHVCPDCESLGSMPPQPLADWPSIPGDGATQCNVGCRCSLQSAGRSIEPGDTYAPELTDEQQATISRVMDNQAQAMSSAMSDAQFLDGMGEAERQRLIEFNPNHDDKGRFATGGGSGGSTPTLTIGPTNSNQMTAYPTKYTADDVKQVQRAVDQVVARSPGIVTGEGGVRKLGGVEFTSNARYGGTTNDMEAANRADQVEALRYAAATFPGHEGSVFGEGAIHITIQDRNGPNVWSGTAEHDAYGIALHELGHAWFDSHGVDSPQTAGSLLEENGIRPVDARGLSRYAAAGAQEALAEMYASKYGDPGEITPMHADLAARFDALEQETSVLTGQSHLSTYSGTWVKGLDMLTGRRVPGIPAPGGLAERAAEQAATQNLAANKWVTSPDEKLRAIKEAALREYNHNHDEHGRFAAGGGSVSVGTPGPDSYLNASDVADVKRAVADAVARNPSLINPPPGGYKLAGVGFASSNTPPPGISQEAWDTARLYGHRPEAVTGRDGRSSFILVGDTHMPAFRDASLLLPPGASMPATLADEGGVVTHEMGHAWANSYGVVSPGQAAMALGAADITPVDVQRAGSMYGASDPREAIAELYSQANSPESDNNSPAGLGRPGIGDKWDVLAKTIEAGPGHLPTGSPGSGPWGSRVLVLTGPMFEQAMNAARKNIAANDWVATSPFLDDAPEGAPLKEFNPYHDEKGRFTTGGGGGSSTPPAGLTPAESWQQDGPWRQGATKPDEATVMRYSTSVVSQSNPLTPDEQRAVDDYAHDSNALNTYERKGVGGPATAAEANALEGAIEDSVTTRDLTVYRGVTASAGVVLNPDGTYRDKAFLSSSLVESTPAEYAASLSDPTRVAPTTFFEIHVPAGSNLLPVSAVASDPSQTLSGHNEAEMLFPTDSRFDVISSTPESWPAHGGGTYQVDHVVAVYAGHG